MMAMTEPEQGAADDDLDARIREHFAKPEVLARTAAELLADQRAAARQAEEPPPLTSIPAPEFPVGLGIGRGVARFHCPRRCGWFHDEPTDPGPARLILPAGASTQDVDELLTLNAEARAMSLEMRVETAIGSHYATAH